MDDKRNSENYPDPTAYAVIKSISDDEKRVSMLIKSIKQIAILCGYEITNRIEIRERKSGKLYR
ncbi:MAG: hypothetical protein Q4G33_04500 [bacterium]|nr:hypothetical protein [bacterium]